MSVHTKSQAPETAPAGIPWRDLLPMSRAETLAELSLPLPWLALALLLYATPLWPLGTAASFMFFLCALRLNHEAIHGNLGLSRRGDHAVLHLLSLAMLGSNHAVTHGHVMHHRHAMTAADHEGRCGEMSLARVLLYGPRFPFDINRTAWAAGPARLRRRMLTDWALAGSGVVLALATGQQALMLHYAAMATAQCLTALFAVWITHRGTQGTGLAARSQRGWLARAAYLMFYHREHHLFPRVPVRRLPRLAARLDRDAPGYAGRRKPVIALFDPAFHRARARLFTDAPQRKTS